MKTQCNFQNSKLPSQKSHLLNPSDRKTLSCYTVQPRLFRESVTIQGLPRDYFWRMARLTNYIWHHSKHCCSFHVHRECFLDNVYLQARLIISMYKWWHFCYIRMHWRLNISKYFQSEMSSCGTETVQNVNLAMFYYSIPNW